MGKYSVAILLAYLILGFSVVASAEGVPEKKPENWGVEQGDDIPFVDAAKEQSLDDVQVEASALLYEVSEWIDSFFDDGRFTEEENESRATLKLGLGYSKNDNFEVQPRLDVRIKLPKLSSRAHLILEAAEDSDFDVDSSPSNSYSDDHSDKEGGEFRAALRWFLKESETYNVAVDAGGSWNYLYGSVRFRSLQDFGSWQGRFTNRLRWYTDDGWENRAAYDLEQPFGDDFFFRSTSKINYYESKDGFPHSQQFKLYQVLSAIRAVSYETIFYMETEPSYQLSDVQVILKYRQRFYRDWLMLEISPKLSFPEDHDREVNPGLFFTLEASFGNNASEEGFKKIFKK